MSPYRSVVKHWPLIMAGVFTTFTMLLLWNLASSQSQLRIATDARLVADSQRRAATISEFIAERRQAVADLASSHEIDAYLANRALGMSPRYGLNATLSFIDQRFKRQIEQKTLRGQPVYAGIAFLDKDGAVLAEAGAEEADLSTRAAAERTVGLVIDPKALRIIASSPVFHKGEFAGTVVTTTDLRLLSRLMIASDVLQADVDYREFLMTDEGVDILAPRQAATWLGNSGSAFVTLPENKLLSAPDTAGVERPPNLLSVRTAINGAPLSILTLISETEAYGQLASPAYALYLGAFSTVLLMAAFGFERLRKRTLQLQEDYSESDRRRGELKQHNQALSAEILRRRAVEAVLQEKSEALDKLNADLRVAAAAFDSQEGMIVSDADKRILRVNRAFTEMTGYAAEELVGKPLRVLKSDHHTADFYSELWESVRRTGGWQGEIRQRAGNGATHVRWLTVSAVKGEDGGVTHYIGTYYDVSERKRAEERIKELAFFDQLTGLPNRALLLDRMRQAMGANSRSGKYGALLFIDLDNFKILNDTLGHDFGDLLLKEVAQRLSQCVRSEDTVARLGGDEFVVLLASLSGQEQKAAIRAKTVGEKVLSSLNQSYQLAGYEHLNTPSIGVALFAGHQDSTDDVLKRADLAMYEAKAVGRNTLRFFDPEMQIVVNTRAALETDFREAVKKSRFLLHYQAQVDGEGRLTGAEVLLRWAHPERGLISPAEFIPLAENTGLIRPLGDWVLETACRQLAAWAEQPELAHLTIAVNVSALQLHHRDFVDHVLSILDLTGARPQRLKLELTESLLVNNIEEVISKMTALKEAGIGFSLDDFGTGYSSLSYLKRLPLDQLKIDQSFVRDIAVDPNDAAIAKMIIVLGANLGLAVIAEGVETEFQRSFLARQGCQAYQGYLFGRPVPLDEFEKDVKTNARPRIPRALATREAVAAVG